MGKHIKLSKEASERYLELTAATPEQQQGFEHELDFVLSSVNEQERSADRKLLLMTHQAAITAAEKKAHLRGVRHGRTWEPMAVKYAVTAAEVALLQQMLLDAKGNEEAGYKPSRSWFISWAEDELEKRGQHD